MSVKVVEMNNVDVIQLAINKSPGARQSKAEESLSCELLSTANIFFGRGNRSNRFPRLFLGGAPDPQ
jgi:hypothetical protein